MKFGNEYKFMFVYIFVFTMQCNGLFAPKCHSFYLTLFEEYTRLHKITGFQFTYIRLFSRKMCQERDCHLISAEILASLETSCSLMTIINHFL